MFPRIPNRYDDDEQRLKRLEAQGEDPPRRPLALVAVGVVLLGATLALARAGWGGAGLILVPIGLGCALGGGIQLAVDWLAR